MSLLHRYQCPCTHFQSNGVGLIGDRLFVCFYSNYVPSCNWRGRSECSQVKGISQEHGSSPFVRLLSPTNWLPSLLSAFCKVGFVAAAVVGARFRLFVTRCDNAFLNPLPLRSAQSALAARPGTERPSEAKRSVLPFARPTLATYKKRRRKETLVLCRLVAVQLRSVRSRGSAYDGR